MKRPVVLIVEDSADDLAILQLAIEELQPSFDTVVALTTSQMPSEITLAYELGVNAYLQKPMGFSSLVSLVEGIQRFWLSCNLLPPAVR
jgi:DNA-binding NarL/FixJ family response regulator